MQYYKKLFHLLPIALVIFGFYGCSHRMAPSIPKTPNLSYNQLVRVEAQRYRASKWFSFKGKIKVNRAGRKLSRELQRTERIDQRNRKHHFSIQTPKTKEMMKNSAKESENLRNRGKFCPRIKRKIYRKHVLKEVSKWTD